MPRPLHEENPEARTRGLDRHKDILYRRGPGAWVTPTLLNSFANPGGNYGDAKYRHGEHWELEFDGYIDVSAATSGTVAFVIGLDYRREKHIDLLTSVRNAGNFSVARMVIDKDTGEATFTWPAT